MGIFTKNKVYLDSASGTIINPKVLKKMLSLDFNKMGNPSSMHGLGSYAKSVLSYSRESLAKTIEAHDDEIIFTGSGTESVALAIMGTVYKSKNEFNLPHIITSTIEHSCVINTCQLLEKMNLAEVSYISPIDSSGLIDPDQIIENIKDNTVLISIHMVNSEIGINQNIPKIIKNLDKYKEQKYNLTKMRFFCQIILSVFTY
jgi:cysteine sulfinate desulfinase/cysteine desulfurase-like protein